MDMMPMIEEIAAQAEENALPAMYEDYIGMDELLYCGKCHTRKQHRLMAPMLQREMVVRVPC